MHKLFLDCLLAHMDGVLAQFEATRGIDHKYQKGFARQALMQTAVEPWFGPSVAIGSGFVINAISNIHDQRGHTSNECDNVLFWPDQMPNMMLGGSSGPSLFPIEGVAAVVEVKSCLTTTELRSALKKLPDATQMNLCSGFRPDPETGGYPGGINFTFPLACILAFESDVAKSTLVDTLEQNTDAWDIACVLGENGGVFFTNGIVGQKQMHTVEYPDDSSPRFLLADFSVLIRDGIQQLHLERMAQAPALRPYVSVINIPPHPESAG
jgi:hypothetical protein